jgi:hypothetical protein
MKHIRFFLATLTIVIAAATAFGTNYSTNKKAICTTEVFQLLITKTIPCSAFNPFLCSGPLLFCGIVKQDGIPLQIITSGPYLGL